MNQTEKDYAEAAKEFVINRAYGICEHENCMEPGTELAHEISKSKMNLKKYGPEIVHHPKLLKWTCKKHNDSFNIGFKPAVIAERIKEIEAAGIENWG